MFFILLILLLSLSIVLLCNRNTERTLTDGEILEIQRNERCKAYIKSMESPTRQKVLILKNFILFPAYIIAFLYVVYTWLLLIMRQLYGEDVDIFKEWVYLLLPFIFLIPLLVISIKQRQWKEKLRDEFMKNESNYQQTEQSEL